MFNTKKIVVLLASSLVLSACGSTPFSSAAAKSSFEQTPLPTTPVKPSVPIVGGLSDVDMTDLDVIAAANFAASRAGSEVQTIIQAQQQVVAGMNYFLVLELKNGSMYDVQVYKKLDNSMSLMMLRKLR